MNILHKICPSGALDVEINRPKARTYAANNNDDAAERRNNIRSPRIRNIGWGCVDVEDIGIFKDVKLYPGGRQHRF